MKSLKFINIYCLIVLAISLVTIGAFVAMNQWVEVISNGLLILILAAMMLRWQSILRKEKELDEREKRLDGLSERVLPIAVGIQVASDWEDRCYGFQFAGDNPYPKYEFVGMTKC